MADTRISQLPSVTTPVASDEIPVNNSGSTKKMTLTQVANAVGYTAHAADLTKHRQINDAGTGATDLWSASKISTELAGKAASSHTHPVANITGVLPVGKGGTGLSTIPANRMLYTSALDTLAELNINATLEIVGGILGVKTNTNTQRIQVSKAATVIGTQKEINFIEGSNVTLTIADNGANERVDVTIAAAQAYPPLFNQTDKPVYATANTITVASIACRDSTNAVNILKTGSTTVDISTTGLNGVARGSANLTGTISYTNASTAVTGIGTAFTTDYVVGDVIFDQTNGAVVGTVDVIGSNTSITLRDTVTAVTRSGASHRRGGESRNTWYYLYAITNGTTPGLLLSTRCVSVGDTLVDLPSGYTHFRQLNFALRNSSSSNIVIFVVGNGWPFMTEILFNDSSYVQGSMPTEPRILNAGAATSWTDVVCSPVCPKNSRLVLLQPIIAGTSGTSSAQMRTNGATNTLYHWFTDLSGGQHENALTPIPTDNAQIIEYQILSSATLSLFGRGFVITEAA